ncbi:MAG: CPBP family intramembrane metalloprotease [Akkermansiaceae bacterium]|nr:CPBP family intramembrane metalloprotease [Akkermansiaceae bacterium]
MSDPTAPVLIATFSVALGLFVVAALVRWARREKEPVLSETEAPQEGGHGGLPQAPPSSLPPPVPPMYGGPYVAPRAAPVPVPDTRGVPTWPYRKLDFLWMAGIFVIFAAMSVSNTAVDADKVSFTPGVLLGSIVFHATLTMITLAVILFRIGPVSWLGLRWKHWPWVFLIAPATVVTMWLVFGGLHALGYMKWMESLGVEAVQDSVKLLQTATDPLVLILMAVAAVLVAPISEEIVFRGYLYPAAKKFAGPWMAAICTGLVFAAAHGSLAALLPLFIFGVVLAVLYEKTGSIWAPVAVHFCFNGATVGMQFLVRQFPQLLDQAAK